MSDKNDKKPTADSEMLDAVKELTKEITSLKKEVKEFKESWELKTKAGKF